MTRSSANKPGVPDDKAIVDLWIAPFAWGAVTAAISSGMTDTLGRSSMSPARLSAKLSLDRDSVESVLRILVAMGFAMQTGEVFALTPAGRSYLVLSSELERSSELFEMFPPLERLHQLVIDALDGKLPKRSFADRWTNDAKDNTHVQSVAAGMDSIIKAPATAVVQSGAFEGVQRILDVGGGSGAFARILTHHHRKLKATILDLPAMCSEASALLRKDQLKRISFHPADFFRDPWAKGCDAILFSNVLHNWSRARGLELLKRARNEVSGVGRRQGRLYVLEVLRNEDRNGPLMATLFHMQMQMVYGGSQYTLSDLRALFNEAGFGVPRVTARFGYYSLLQANAR